MSDTIVTAPEQAEMRRVADEYEVWLRADTARMQSRSHERLAHPSDADAFA